MSQQSNWRKSALCIEHENPSLWLSSNIDDLNYARSYCIKCPVRVPCVQDAVTSENYIGIRGGITEYEFLSGTWVEVDDVEETNWPRSDSIIQRLLRDYA